MVTIVAAAIAAIAAVIAAGRKPGINKRVVQLERRVDELTADLAKAQASAAAAVLEVERCRAREQGLWDRIELLEGKR